MNDLKLIVAKNISSLRREREMTQFELAEKLSYSDKAVSKWERGESIPDVVVLKSIADLFSVTVDYLLEDEHPKKKNLSHLLKVKMQNHGFITGMAITLVWLLALFAFIIGDYFKAWTGHLHWLSFLYPVPISLVLWLIFNSIWFNPRKNFLIISLLMWSVLITIYISLLVIWNIDLRLFPSLGLPGQAIILMWSKIKRNSKGV